MSPFYIILALVPISVAFRYLLEQDAAAKLIGIKIAPPEFLAIEKSGHQTAVMVPGANKWFFLSLGLLIVGVAWLWLAFGWLYGVIGAMVVCVSGLFAQLTFLPKGNSRHFVLSIFASMSRRYADYERDGDKERAAAMRDLLDRFTTSYEDVLTKREPNERIISKSDADYIFSLDRAGWESYAERMVHPGGWKIQLSRHDTGTGVMAFDSATGMGLSTQPLYPDATKPPLILIVGSYYPAGTLRTLTPKRKAGLEKDAQADLGSEYTVTVTVTHFSQPPMDGIELRVTRSEPAG